MNSSLKLIASLILTATLSSAFAEPANLSLLRQEVESYHDSGHYAEELATTIEQARHYIVEQATKNKTSKLALILDIDETSLSNYDKMAKRHFSGTHKQVHQEILAAEAPPIKPMLSLYQEAMKHGVKVFFVTGRAESEREATHKNLIKAGYAQWSGLYLRPNEYKESSIIPFKSGTRAKIEQKGYTIIASIGDQYSDIKGGHTQKGYKLPNPFYYLP